MVMIATSRLLLEVAVSSPDDARIAQANGADRLELCAALCVGGLTPSLGANESVRQASSLPLLVLIRPRPAGFCYSDEEFAAMCRDAELAMQAGADGLVFGILKPDGQIDSFRCDRLLKIAGRGRAVFHRAFDVVPNPYEALEQLIELGFCRILTSGQAASALQGTSLIRSLVERAGSRIEILPGGGIKPTSVREVLQFTDCRQVHGSFRCRRLDSSTAHRPQIRFGGDSPSFESEFDITDGDAVRAMRAILDEITQRAELEGPGKLGTE
jgi:copper homeostasis protein